MTAAPLAPLPASVAGRSSLDPLGLALQHAARGWLVLPTRNKQPLTRHGVKDATADPDTIRAWWARHPDAEPAVTDCDVLDLDRKPGQQTDPVDALRDAGLDVADLPPGMFVGVSRGGAGCHVFGVGNVGNGKPMPGVTIDGRGRGTFVVGLYDLPERATITGAFPESVLGCASSSASSLAVCEMPEKNPDPPASVVAKAREDVAQVLADAEALRLLHEGETYVLPGYPDPVGWDTGYFLIAQRLAGIAAHPDTDYDMSAAAADFLAHAPEAEGTFSPGHKWSDGASVPHEYRPLTVAQMFPDLTDPSGLTAFERLAARAAHTATSPPPVLTPDYYAPFGDALMYGGVLNSLVGPGGVMKTTLSLLACSRHPAYSLFVSLEKSEPALLSTAQWVSADTGRMLVASSLDEAEAVIASAPANADMLVVIDSAISVMGAMGVDENDASGLARVETRLKGWREADPVACVVLLDHTGHGDKGRARGSSRKGQMIQGREWVLRTPNDKRPEPGDVVTATCTKDNSGKRGTSWMYELTPDRGPVAVFGSVPSAVDAQVAADAARLLTMLADTGVDYPSGTKARDALPGGRDSMNGGRYKAAAEHLEALGLVERPKPGRGERAAVGLRLLPAALADAIAAGEVSDDGTPGQPVYSLAALAVHESPDVSGNHEAE